MKLLAVFLRVGCILSLTQALPVNFTVHTGSFIPVNGSVTVHAEIPVNPSGPIKGLCDFKKQNCSPRIGAQCPQCDSSGNFLPVQCSGSTGYCWCVNVITGELVPNSTVPPGHMPPKCGETKDEDDSDSRSSEETKEEKDSDSSSSDESMTKPDKEEETKEEKDSHSSSSDKSKEQKEESDSSSSEETKEEKDSDSSSSDKSKKPKEESDCSSSEETKEEKDSDSSSSDESMKKPDKEDKSMKHHEESDSSSSEETKEEKDSHSSSSDKSQKDKDESDSSSSEETKEKKDSDSSSSDKSMKHQKESDCSSSEETKEDKDSVSSSSDKPMKHQDDSKSSSSEEDAGCPHDWTRFDQQCFVFIDSPKSWAEAESYCQFDGSNLASVHSYEENHFLQSLTRGDSHNFPQAWIGGTDTMHLGLWTWSDGSKFLYENWSDDDKDGDSHRCLKINYDYEFKWTAARCSESLPFVCSKNVEKEKEE